MAPWLKTMLSVLAAFLTAGVLAVWIGWTRQQRSLSLAVDNLLSPGGVVPSLRVSESTPNRRRLRAIYGGPFPGAPWLSVSYVLSRKANLEQRSTIAGGCHFALHILSRR